MHDALRDRLRDADGRDPMASAGIIDAQSVKGADTVAARSRGYDAGKKVNGRKRHIVVDTLGLLMLVAVTTASVQDRDGGRMILERRRWVVERTFAWLVRCRRLDRDYERLSVTSEARVKWAMIGIMIRRLEPGPGRRPWQPADAT